MEFDWVDIEEFEGNYQISLFEVRGIRKCELPTL